MLELRTRDDDQNREVFKARMNTIIWRVIDKTSDVFTYCFRTCRHVKQCIDPRLFVSLLSGAGIAGPERMHTADEAHAEIVKRINKKISSRILPPRTRICTRGKRFLALTN